MKKRNMKLCVGGLVVCSLLFGQSMLSAGVKVSPTWNVMQREFADPAKEYRAAPLWVWNSRVTREEIDRMLLELKEAGFGGAFVHPRPGMITEYLSPEWFDLFLYSVEVGKRLGLDIWIYDENSYPSGYAGGHVPEQMPESYNQGQGLQMSDCEVLPADVQDCYLVLKREDGAYRDITADVARYSNVRGEYVLWRKTYYGRSGWMAGYSYVDLMQRGVTEKFIDITFTKGYEPALGSELRPVVKGIFSDEPQIESSGGIRWTPDLFGEFENRWGYSLVEYLPLLVREEGRWKEVRHHYSETLLHLFIERWAKPMHDYCEDKGLLWTGHYWEHNWPDLFTGPDNMAMYAWHQMPAVDMLFNQYNDENPQAQFGNVRAIKELRSVANQMGRERTLSETYGGGGWDLTFQDLKRLGDWEYALGVNFMNQHLVHMTLTGARKYDYPISFTYHTPWWPYYKTQNDYFGRLSYILSQGRQENDVLVLEPTTSLWCYYSFYGSHARLRQTGEAFQTFVTKLEKAQVEYDLGCEDILKDHGSVRGGRLAVGHCAYATVVIPPMMENIERNTLELLRRFVAAGGELVAYSVPTLVDGRESREPAELLASSGVLRPSGEDVEEAVALLGNDRIVFTQVDGDDVYHQRRVYPEGEVVFLANASLEREAAVSLHMEGRSVVEMDAATGECFRYPADRQGGRCYVSATLPPAGSLLLYVSGKKVKCPARQEVKMTGMVQPTGAMEVQPLCDNVLYVDFCDLALTDTCYKDIHFADAAQKYFNFIGEPNDPWGSSVQFRSETVARDGRAVGQAKAIYHIQVADGVDASQFKLVAEQPSRWRVRVNGRPVEPIPGEWWLDCSFGVYPVGGLLHPGENTVELDIVPLSIFAEIQPVYVVGDFSLRPAEHGWCIVPPLRGMTPGSWKEQGMPFYAWEVGYTCRYRIDEVKAGYQVKLKDWNGTMAAVRVNGELVGLISCPPYRLDVSKWIRSGDNTIEVQVVGSNRNLLGPHHNRPAQGIAGPWMWQNIYGPTPPATAYSLLDYGMNEAFELWTGGK